MIPLPGNDASENDRNRVLHFTSDTHFGQRGIMAHCRRPFATPADMDEALIERWNAVVKPTDEIWHLGDFAKTNAARIFRRLNGRKHLVLGNHDREGEVGRLPWASVTHYARISDGGVTFILSHYPMVEWELYFRNAPDRIASVQLFGHVHGRPDDQKHVFHPFQLDVGVDANDYAPISRHAVLTKVRERVAEALRRDPGWHPTHGRGIVHDGNVDEGATKAMEP